MPPTLVNGVVGIGYVVIFQSAIIAAAQAFPVLAPMVAASLDMAPEYVVGYFSALVMASALLSSTGLAGWLRRVGSLAGAAMTLVLSGAGVLVLAFSTSVAGLCVSAVMIGIAYGPVNPAGSRLLIRVTQGFRRNLVFSFKQTSVAIGGAAAATLLPLIAIPYGWRAAMISMALVSIVVALSTLPVRSRLTDDGERSASVRLQSPLGPVRLLLSDPSLRALSWAVLAFSSAQFGIMSVYVTLLWSRAGLSPGAAAGMLSLALVASAVGRVGWGWAADRHNPVLIMAGLAASGAVAILAMLALKPGMPMSAAAVVSLALGFGTLSWSGVFMAEIAYEGMVRGGDHNVLTITGGMMVFGYLGGLLAPMSLSLSAMLFGDYAPGALLIAAGLAASALILIRKDRRFPSSRPKETSP